MLQHRCQAQGIRWMRPCISMPSAFSQVWDGLCMLLLSGRGCDLFTHAAVMTAQPWHSTQEEDHTLWATTMDDTDIGHPSS